MKGRWRQPGEPRCRPSGPKGHDNEEWVKQYGPRELESHQAEPQPITVKQNTAGEAEPAAAEELAKAAVAAPAETAHEAAEAEGTGLAGFANADQYGAMP